MVLISCFLKLLMVLASLTWSGRLFQFLMVLEKRKIYTRHDKLKAKYDVPGILISLLLILYIMISRDLSRRISRAS